MWRAGGRGGGSPMAKHKSTNIWATSGTKKNWKLRRSTIWKSPLAFLISDTILMRARSSKLSHNCTMGVKLPFRSEIVHTIVVVCQELCRVWNMLFNSSAKAISAPHLDCRASYVQLDKRAKRRLPIYGFSLGIWKEFLWARLNSFCWKMREKNNLCFLWRPWLLYSIAI
jgi:hypothetical protein